MNEGLELSKFSLGKSAAHLGHVRVTLLKGWPGRGRTGGIGRSWAIAYRFRPTAQYWTRRIPVVHRTSSVAPVLAIAGLAPISLTNRLYTMVGRT